MSIDLGYEKLMSAPDLEWAVKRGTGKFDEVPMLMSDDMNQLTSNGYKIVKASSTETTFEIYACRVRLSSDVRAAMGVSDVSSPLRRNSEVVVEVMYELPFQLFSEADTSNVKKFPSIKEALDDIEKSPLNVLWVEVRLKTTYSQEHVHELMGLY